MMRCWAMEESFLRLMTVEWYKKSAKASSRYIVLFFFLFSCRLAGTERGLKVGNSFYFVPFFLFSVVWFLQGKRPRQPSHLYIVVGERVGADLLHHHWADDGRETKGERNCWPCLFLSLSPVSSTYGSFGNAGAISLTRNKKN